MRTRRHHSCLSICLPITPCFPINASRSAVDSASGSNAAMAWGKRSIGRPGLRHGTMSTCGVIQTWSISYSISARTPMSPIPDEAVLQVKCPAGQSRSSLVSLRRARDHTTSTISSSAPIPCEIVIDHPAFARSMTATSAAAAVLPRS